MCAVAGTSLLFDGSRSTLAAGPRFCFACSVSVADLTVRRPAWALNLRTIAHTIHPLQSGNMSTEVSLRVCVRLCPLDLRVALRLFNCGVAVVASL